MGKCASVPRLLWALYDYDIYELLRIQFRTCQKCCPENERTRCKNFDHWSLADLWPSSPHASKVIDTLAWRSYQWEKVQEETTNFTNGQRSRMDMIFISSSSKIIYRYKKVEICCFAQSCHTGVLINSISTLLRWRKGVSLGLWLIDTMSCSKLSCS